MKALAVFHGASDHPLARWLKPGFRHCFVALLVNGCWILVDGNDGIPVIRYLAADDFDLAGFYRDQGYTVVETHQRDTPLVSPAIATNCTGIVKAVLSLRAPLAITPWRLYRHLMKEST